MSLIDVISAALLLCGAFFFLAGTVGLLRFPDVLSRLHAVTKADNLGLGFVVLGIVITVGSPFAIVKLVLIWMLALAASTTTCQLIAGVALRERTEAADRDAA